VPAVNVVVVFNCLEHTWPQVLPLAYATDTHMPCCHYYLLFPVRPVPSIWAVRPGFLVLASDKHFEVTEWHCHGNKKWKWETSEQGNK